MNHIEPEIVVDARGVLCPEPVLRARLALDPLNEGQVLELVATDPHAELDIAVFCETTGHRLLSSRLDGDAWHFLIARGGRHAGATGHHSPD